MFFPPARVRFAAYIKPTPSDRLSFLRPLGWQPSHSVGHSARQAPPEVFDLPSRGPLAACLDDPSPCLAIAGTILRPAALRASRSISSTGSLRGRTADFRRCCRQRAIEDRSPLRQPALQRAILAALEARPCGKPPESRTSGPCVAAPCRSCEARAITAFRNGAWAFLRPRGLDRIEAHSVSCSVCALLGDLEQVAIFVDHGAFDGVSA
jgi:hypothetical protein